MIKKIFTQSIDWWIIGSVGLLLLFSSFTLSDFQGSQNYVIKQSLWAILSLTLLISVARVDMTFLKKPWVLFSLYGFANILLILVLFFGKTINGSTSWFSFGSISFQPSDFAKLILVLILAKYLSRRHVEIANFRHIIRTGIYLLIPCSLIFLQPDFGSALVLGSIWFFMVLISGISKKHLLILLSVGVILFTFSWTFLFKPYQKNRIITFIHPLSDIRGSGYNAYQSMIAVGSGGLIGKGVGFGTQSRLQFLPEYETDFIFAAFSEEWGFVGAFLVISCFGIILWRLLRIATYGTTNFEILYAIGLAIYFSSHVIINIGMNIGIMPVTGIPLPFMSYGGSHLIIECLAIGILLSFSRNSRNIHRDEVKYEFLGV